MQLCKGEKSCEERRVLRVIKDRRNKESYRGTTERVARRCGVTERDGARNLISRTTHEI